MDAKTWTIAALAGVTLTGAMYVAFPCLTLYRLDNAVSRGDSRTLRALVDWPEVRRGIEADLAGDADDLPSFGTAFMRTVAVKAAMTPENVIAALHAVDQHDGSARLRGAWMEGPCTVIVDLGTARLRMQLQAGEWRVTRVWLPETVLTNARAIAQR